MKQRNNLAIIVIFCVFISNCCFRTMKANPLPRHPARKMKRKSVLQNLQEMIGSFYDPLTWPLLQNIDLILLTKVKLTFQGDLILKN